MEGARAAALITAHFVEVFTRPGHASRHPNSVGNGITPFYR